MKKWQLKRDKLISTVVDYGKQLKEILIGENIDQKQLKYLSQTIQLEEKANPYLIRATMTLISGTVLFFILWSSFTDVNEVTRATGVVVPQGRVHKVQHLKGGLIKKIHVKEGQVVLKNQPLISLDDTLLEHEISSLEAKKLTLTVKRERIHAIIENRKPNFNSIGIEDSDQLNEQKRFYNQARLGFEKEKEVIIKQIKQKELRIKSLQNDYRTYVTKKGYVEEAYNTQSALLKKGLVSKITYLNSKKEFNDITGTVKKLEHEISSSIEAREELIQKKVAIESNYLERSYEEFDQINLQVKQVSEQIASVKAKKKSMTLRANVNGTIKGVTTYTSGEILEPGQTILEVVPLTDSLYVELNVSPNDVGHLEVGQKVNVKFNTYDFSRYGFVETSLEQISATTFLDRKGLPYYKAIAQLPKNYLGREPSSHVITSGMTLEASIITGEKSVLSYLLKPIHRSIESSLTER